MHLLQGKDLVRVINAFGATTQKVKECNAVRLYFYINKNHYPSPIYLIYEPVEENKDKITEVSSLEEINECIVLATIGAL